MKILVLCPNALDATSYYRAWGCFADIAKRTNITFTASEQAFMKVGTKHEFFFDPKETIAHRVKTYSLGLVPNVGTQYAEIEQPKWYQAIANRFGLAWPSLLMYDALFIQRGFDMETYVITTYAKELGLKIIYDIDDNLWEIPESFSFKKQYDAECLQRIEAMIRMADLVTVSTQALKDYIDNRVMVSCEVINNGWDLQKYPIQPFSAEGPTVWRGSGTHAHDLEHHRAEIEAMTDLQFWGYDPVNNEPKLKCKSAMFKAPSDHFVYFRSLMLTKPKALIVPLTPDVFNEAKSNIAWLEATASGAVCISNKHGEFDRGFIMPFNMDQSEGSRETCYDMSKEVITKSYDLKQLNDKRIALYQALMQ